MGQSEVTPQAIERCHDMLWEEVLGHYLAGDNMAASLSLLAINALHTTYPGRKQACWRDSASAANEVQHLNPHIGLDL